MRRQSGRGFPVGQFGAFEIVTRRGFVLRLGDGLVEMVHLLFSDLKKVIACFVTFATGTGSRGEF